LGSLRYTSVVRIDFRERYIEVELPSQNSLPHDMVGLDRLFLYCTPVFRFPVQEPGSEPSSPCFKLSKLEAMPAQLVLERARLSDILFVNHNHLHPRLLDTFATRHTPISLSLDAHTTFSVRGQLGLDFSALDVLALGIVSSANFSGVYRWYFMVLEQRHQTAVVLTC
jgi:hypothetical protein